jgi:hypothetical protein
MSARYQEFTLEINTLYVFDILFYVGIKIFFFTFLSEQIIKKKLANTKYHKKKSESEKSNHFLIKPFKNIIKKFE